MSDETTQPDAETTETTENVKTFDEAYVKKLREEAAGYRTKLKEFEDRDKSEVEKLTDRAEAAEAALAAKEAEATRLSVIAAKGIPADYHDLVRGGTQEELEASADKVASLIEAKAEQKPSPLIIPAEGKTPTGALGGSKQAFADAIADLL